MNKTPEPDFKALAAQYHAQLRRAEKVLKMAYRKHVEGDESIGWNELGDALGDMLAEFKQERAAEKAMRWFEGQEKGETR